MPTNTNNGPAYKDNFVNYLYLFSFTKDAKLRTSEPLSGPNYYDHLEDFNIGGAIDEEDLVNGKDLISRSKMENPIGSSVGLDLGYNVYGVGISEEYLSDDYTPLWPPILKTPNNDPNYNPYAYNLLNTTGEGNLYSYNNPFSSTPLGAVEDIQRVFKFSYNFQSTGIFFKNTILLQQTDDNAGGKYPIKKSPQSFQYSQQVPLRSLAINTEGLPSLGDPSKSNIGFLSSLTADKYKWAIEGQSMFAKIKYFFNKLPADAISNYCNAVIGIPYDLQEYTFFGLSDKNLGVNIKQPTYEKIYNYYDPQYEPVAIELATNTDLDEKFLPSIYDFLYSDGQPEFKAFLGLPGYSAEKINFSAFNQYLDTYANYLIAVFNKSGIEYDFEGYSVEFNKIANSEPADQEFLLDWVYNRKAKKIPAWAGEFKKSTYFSETDLDTFKQTNDKEFVFPFFVKINIPSEAKGPITRLLSEVDLLNDLNQYAATLVTNPAFYGGTKESYAAGVLSSGDINEFNLSENLALNTFKIFLNDEDTLEYNTDIHIDQLGTIMPPPFPPEVGSPLDAGVLTYGKTLDKNLANYTDIAKLIKALKTEKMKKKLDDIVTQLIKGPNDVSSGKFVHQETIMYEIAKYKIDDKGIEAYIQSIFLPVTDADTLSYYDTQVIPYRDYFYKIFAHKILLGSQYWPLKDGVSMAAVGVPLFELFSHFLVNYEIRPYLKAVRVPYYNVSSVNLITDSLNYTRVEDKPPLPPDIQFVPFRNVDDKVLILLNNSVGQLETHPITIFDSDLETLHQTYISQNKIEGQKLIFKSDDSEGIFQLIRVDKPPIAYTDFNKALRRNITEFFSFGESKDDSMVDHIKPNKDFYYTARFIDIHGKISNPTDIFKIRMVKEGGFAPFLKVEVLDLKEIQKSEHNKKFSTVKSMKKYIYIQPNVQQTAIDIDDPDIPLEPSSELGNFANYPVEFGKGVVKQTVFGKKFKIRLTSKQTGKKVDINFTVKTPENIVNN